MIARLHRESWYRDGACVVLVVTGMPQDPVRVGVGEPGDGRRDLYADARDSLTLTPIQSAGPDSGEASALRWAHHAGWISRPDLAADEIPSDS